MDAFRNDVINENFGQDLARGFNETRGGAADEPGRRRREFLALLQSSRLPAELR